MITRRFFLVLVLLSSPAFPQSSPDFSGIFFRTGAFIGKPARNRMLPAESIPPLVLVVSQSGQSFGVTAMQNGATSTCSYRTDGAKRVNMYGDGVLTVDRAKFKKEKLLIQSTLVARAGALGTSTNDLHVKQTWDLSPDRQTLVISGDSPVQGHLGTETYSRLPTLDAAMTRAEAASEMNRCNGSLSAVANQLEPGLEKGVLLGITAYKQFTRGVSFVAGLGGPFFQGLVRSDGPSGREFLKNGQRIETFPDSVALEIEPWVSNNSLLAIDPLATLPGHSGVPEELLNLHFRLKWIGSVTRDLGEVRSDLITEVWPELKPPRKWYKIEVPAKNVPLDDNLEIRILTNEGKQLGCISGHL